MKLITLKTALCLFVAIGLIGWGDAAAGSGGNVATGPWALSSDIVNVDEGTGINNTADGWGTLRYNTAGSSNTVIGLAALYRNTVGYGNTANGYQALFKNATDCYGAE
jgi:hypothetical protein